MGATSGAAEQFAHLVGEAPGDRQPDELVVVRLDARASSARVDLDADLGADDLQRWEHDLEIDLHVVDRHRVRVDIDVQPRRLLVAHGAADQQQIVTFAEGPDSGSRDRAAPRAVRRRRRSERPGGSCWCRTDRRAHVAPGRSCRPSAAPYHEAGRRIRPTGGCLPCAKMSGVTELAVIALSGRFVLLEPMSAGHVEEIAAAGRGDRSSFGFTQVPDGPEEAAAYVDWLLDDAAHGRAAPFVQRRVADGTVVGSARFLNPQVAARSPRPRRGRDRRHLAVGIGPAHAGQQRGQAAAADALLRRVERTARGNLHRRPQRAEPPSDRTSRRHLRRRAAPSPTIDPTRRGRGSPRHGDVLDRDRRLADDRGPPPLLHGQLTSPTQHSRELVAELLAHGFTRRPGSGGRPPAQMVWDTPAWGRVGCVRRGR